MATVNEKMTAIADAIRDKTGRMDALTLDDMADGVTQVYDAGKQAQYDAFWDEFLDFGARTYYPQAFGWWSSEYIRPNRKISFINTSDNPAHSIFRNCHNLKKIEKEYFDFSQYVPASDVSTRSWYYTFAHCRSIEYFEDLSLQAGGYYYTWAACYNLHTIEIMRCKEEGMYRSPFAYCSKLENLTIEGVIGTSFTTQNSPLAPESLKSVITHLKDYSGTDSEYTYTVTFLTSAFEALEAEEATAPNNNTWAEYIDDLKWNLALA